MLISKFCKSAFFIFLFLFILGQYPLHMKPFNYMKKSDCDKKLDIVKGVTSDILSASNIKEMNVMYSYSGEINKFKQISFFLVIDGSYNIDEGRIILVRSYLECLKKINSHSILENLISPFPYGIKNISIYIDFCDKFSFLSQVSPFVSKIHADRGGIEYLSLLGFSKEYVCPSLREDFFSAYEKVKGDIHPDLQEVAQNISKCIISLPNVAQRENDYTAKHFPQHLYR